MENSSQRLKTLIEANAQQIGRLHSRVHETAQSRHLGHEQQRTWERACAAFHASYDTLAFPGGFEGALQRIVAGDAEAMEAAICFLELLLYFFRSGYMFVSILRKAKRAPLTTAQTQRLQKITEALATWRAKKTSQ